MLQKLDDEGIEHNHIKQVINHKNITTTPLDYINYSFHPLNFCHD